MQSISTKAIVINGCVINTLQGGDTSKQTLFFLHGKAFQAETWKELGTLQAIIDAGFSFLAIDLPGFGQSAEADIAEDIIINKVMESADLEQIILVGPSMGGKIALEFCLDNPEKISALVLVGAVGIQENKERLHNLPESTLIVWGEQDQISEPANGVLLHNEVAGSKLVTFQGAKHPCYLEQPELWHKTLLNFVEEI